MKGRKWEEICKDEYGNRITSQALLHQFKIFMDSRRSLQNLIVDSEKELQNNGESCCLLPSRCELSEVLRVPRGQAPEPAQPGLPRSRDTG